MIRVDLRSDTVSHPTPEMRQAMYEAEVGDDVYGDDPTVNRLQEMAAERLGKEAGLMVSSGTQGNLSSLLAQPRLINRQHVPSAGPKKPRQPRKNTGRNLLISPRVRFWRRRFLGQYRCPLPLQERTTCPRTLS